MDAKEDTDRIRRYQRGDQHVFKELFQQYYQYVYKVFVLKGVPPPDAEDFTQDVFLKLTESLYQFQFKSSFKTYLDRILTNKLINFYRKSRPETLLLESEFGELSDRKADSKPVAENPGSELPSALLETSELREILNKCMQKIKNLACRAVLAMWVDGLKLRQIKDMLQLPAGTVNSHLVRGKSLLKRCVQEQYA